MTPISEQLRIYRIAPGELTMKQIRENFGNWKGQYKLNELVAFYDQDEDMVLIGPAAHESQIDFCIETLSAIGHNSLNELNQYLNQLQIEANRTVCIILMRAISKRIQMAEQERNDDVNPNSKFISIDGDIFQISKIVSVKKRDDANRYYIEFYITNKRASIKKEFSSLQLRNSEFQRIQKTLEMVA